MKIKGLYCIDTLHVILPAHVIQVYYFALFVNTVIILKYVNNERGPTYCKLILRDSVLNVI